MMVRYGGCYEMVLLGFKSSVLTDFSKDAR